MMSRQACQSTTQGADAGRGRGAGYAAPAVRRTTGCTQRGQYNRPTMTDDWCVVSLSTRQRCCLQSPCSGLSDMTGRAVRLLLMLCSPPGTECHCRPSQGNSRRSRIRCRRHSPSHSCCSNNAWVSIYQMRIQLIPYFQSLQYNDWSCSGHNIGQGGVSKQRR